MEREGESGDSGGELEKEIMYIVEERESRERRREWREKKRVDREGESG